MLFIAMSGTPPKKKKKKKQDSPLLENISSVSFKAMKH